MLCQKCHKNLATVRYAEVVDGKVTDVHLCSECMMKHQENAATGFNLSGPAPSPRHAALTGQSASSEQQDSVVQHRTCSACGVQLKYVLKTGEVGCPQCYENFAEQLEPVLRAAHTALRHRGRVPHRNDAREALRAELQTKRALLRTALKMENYEEAAELRDEIKKLDASMNASARGEG